MCETGKLWRWGVRRMIAAVMGALAFGAFLTVSGAPFPPGSLLSAATTGPAAADGRAWVFGAWIPGDPGLLAGRRLGIYARRGPVQSDAPFQLRGTVMPGAPVSEDAARGWIAAGVALGDGPDELAAALDALVEDPTIRAAGSPAAKLVASLSLSVSQPAVAEVLAFLESRFRALRLARGHGWAARIEAGPVTLEVRDQDPVTGGDRFVVARWSLEAGVPVPLPAPEAPRSVRPEPGLAGLRVGLVWAASTELKHRQPLVAGFRVWRIPGVVARSAGFDRQPPTLDALMALPGAEPVNRLPIVPRRILDEVEVDLLARHGGSGLLTDSGPEGAPWRDGDEVAWVVAAEDLLGQPGRFSNAGFGHVCDLRAPDLPRGLQAEDRFEPGASARRHYLALRWNAVSETDWPADRFEIFRGSTNLPPVASTNEPAASQRVGVVNARGGAEPYEWRDPSLDAGTDPTLLGRGFWYAVRAVRETSCGPVMSALSPPVFVNFRRMEAPDPPTGDLWINCPRVVVAAAPEPPTRETVAPGPAPQRHFRLVIRRRDSGVAWVEITVQTGVDTPSSIASARLRYGAGDASVDFEFSVPGLVGGMTPRATVVAGSYAGARSEPFVIELPADLLETLRHVQWLDVATRTIAGSDPTDPLAAGIFTGPFTLADARRGDGDAPIEASSPTSEGEVLVQAASARGGGWRFVSLTSPLPTGAVGSPRLVFQDPGVPDGPISDLVRYRAWIVRPPRAGSDGGCAHVARPADVPEVVPVGIRLWPTPRATQWRIFRRVEDGPLTLIAEGAVGVEAAGRPPLVEARDDGMPPGSARLCYFGQLADENGNWSPLAGLGCEDVLPVAPPIPLLERPESGGTVSQPLVHLRWFCPSVGVRRFRIILQPRSGSLPAQGAAAEVAEWRPMLVAGQRPESWAGDSTDSTVRRDMIVGATFETGPVGDPPAPGALGDGPVFNFALEVERDRTYDLRVAAVDDRGNVGPGSLAHSFTWREPRSRAGGDVPWPQRPLPAVGPLHPDMKAVLLSARDLLWPAPDRRDAYPVGIRIGRIPLGDREPIDDLGRPNSGEHGGLLLRMAAARRASLGTGPEGLLFTDVLSSPPRPTFHPLPAVLYREQIPSAEYPEVTSDVVQVSTLVRGVAAHAFPNGSGFEFLDSMLGLTLETPTDGGAARSVEVFLLDLHPVVQGARYRYWLVHFDDRGEPDQTVPAGEVEVPR